MQSISVICPTLTVLLDGGADDSPIQHSGGLGAQCAPVVRVLNRWPGIVRGQALLAT
jgi:hypothetical protein